VCVNPHDQDLQEKIREILREAGVTYHIEESEEAVSGVPLLLSPQFSGVFYGMQGVRDFAQMCKDLAKQGP
jgi:hypothetical protein